MIRRLAIAGFDGLIRLCTSGPSNRQKSWCLSANHRSWKCWPAGISFLQQRCRPAGKRSHQACRRTVSCHRYRCTACVYMCVFERALVCLYTYDDVYIMLSRNSGGVDLFWGFCPGDSVRGFSTGILSRGFCHTLDWNKPGWQSQWDIPFSMTCRNKQNSSSHINLSEQL